VKSMPKSREIRTQLGKRHPACFNAHDLRIAQSSLLHQKYPQISCRENSTLEHH
jgi:hypothetical protein